MVTETNNWQAFSLATDALRDIDRFVSSSSKNRTVLVGAKEKLKSAVEKDPRFSRARYYSAIVDDMLGLPANAVTQLETLIASGPDFKVEAQYNLGVSYYHLYSRDEIDKAIAEFEIVAAKTCSSALKYMAQAGLIRSFAMMVLHNALAGDLTTSGQYFNQVMSESELLLDALKSDPSLDRKTRKEIRWRALNGQGVGRMFYSDSETDLGARTATLNLAKSNFEEADKLSPNNWETVCNLGSVHMRLGAVAIQVKRHKGKISAEQIRSFVGALVLQGLTTGIYVTTSSYEKGGKRTAAAAQDQLGVAVNLVDGGQFYDALRITAKATHWDPEDPSAPYFRCWHNIERARSIWGSSW